MDLKTTLKTIDDTLRIHRKYIIPRFQREFSWENEELNQMFDDLIDNITIDSTGLKTNDYFIGSLVLVGNDDDSSNINRLIVDGQQRLTTFTIAFAVLSQKFKEIGEEKLSEKTHLNIIGEDNDGNPYTKLINEHPKPFFQNRIQKKDIDFGVIPQTGEEKRLQNAYNFFDRQLKEQNLIKAIKKQNNFDGKIKYVDALKAFRDQILKCRVIYVTVDSIDDAYVIFEVLNSKGKDLSPTDMIKNSIFSILTEEEPLDLAMEKWKCIKSEIKKCDAEDFSTFYRHFWLSKYCLSTSKKLVANFNKYIDKTIEGYSEFLDSLYEASKNYTKIVSPNLADWSQPENLSVYTSLKAFEIFNVTQVRVFLLSLLYVKERNLITHKNFIKIINFLEHYHFIFTAVCSSRPSGLERRYSSYARKLGNCSTKEESANCIRDLINDLSGTLPPYASFESDFSKLIYTSYQEKNKKVVQYILKKLERFYSTDELKPNSFTIEHILPESKKYDYVGMIGNLLPLGEKLNSELSDKDFNIKIKRYEESQYSTVKHFVMVYGENKDWSEENIVTRTNTIAKILYENIIEG